MKTLRPLLQEIELLAFFQQHDYRISNKHKVELSLHAPETIIATHRFISDKIGRYTIDLLADYDRLQTFIADSELRSFADIHNVSRSTLWVRYLQGNGYVCCDLAPGVELCFRLIKGVTIVYSVQLHFYDEIYKVLSIPEQFEAYLQQHWDRLQLMMLATTMLPS